MPVRPRKLKLLVAYDGTDFHGFQRQPGRRTVQAVLEEALGRLAGHPVTVVGAGRTDAGVHAAGQVVHCTVAGSIPTERIPQALQGLLPPDVVVYAAEEVDESFHARKSARAKVYRYSVLVAPFPWPFIRRYVLHEPRPLDVAAMRAGAAHLVGRHDFAAFQAAGRPVRDTVRTVHRLELDEQVMPWGRIVHITVEADGFLYHMARNIAGTLLEVGRGRRPPEWVAEVLASRRRERAGPTAPAHGLTLLEVRYDEAPRPARLRLARAAADLREGTGRDRLPGAGGP